MHHSNRPKLIVTTETWNRDSHGLFDYESDNVHKRTMKTAEDCYLVRNDNDTQLVTEPLQDSVVLAHLQYFGGGFRIISCDDANEGLWQVVRASHTDQLGVPIDPGTTIKLGRVQILVSELTKEVSPGASTLSSDDELEEEQRQCKICFGTNEYDNVLISPCDCSGSVRYVHLECLQRWLTSKCAVSSAENFTSYFWKSMHCELCKKVYPFSLTAGGRTVSLFKLSKSDELTVALELLARDHHGQAVHILATKQTTSLKLGRGHESDLRISDISVSRCHAILNIRAGQFFIQDNTSKFGTLIKLPREIFVDRDTTLVVQTGRTVSTFQLIA